MPLSPVVGGGGIPKAQEEKKHQRPKAQPRECGRRKIERKGSRMHPGVLPSLVEHAEERKRPLASRTATGRQGRGSRNGRSVRRSAGNSLSLGREARYLLTGFALLGPSISPLPAALGYEWETAAVSGIRPDLPNGGRWDGPRGARRAGSRGPNLWQVFVIDPVHAEGCIFIGHLAGQSILAAGGRRGRPIAQRPQPMAVALVHPERLPSSDCVLISWRLWGKTVHAGGLFAIVRHGIFGKWIRLCFAKRAG